MPATLILTNDFPPRIGGIESFVRQVCDFLDHDVVVLTSRAAGAAAYDHSLPFEVIRQSPVLLPRPATAALAADLLDRTGADRVVFGAAAPLGLLAAGLRRAGARRLIALSHGHETWWARTPATAPLLRRIADTVDAFTTISDYTTARIAPALSPAGRAKLVRLAPPVDTDFYRPGRRRVVSERPRCVAVGRLVRQKGFDTLLRAWRRVLDRWPQGPAGPVLTVVGDGPQRRALAGLARRLDLGPALALSGALEPAGVRAQLQRARVFAVPMRTRLRGLNPEGLGLAALEAGACGLPVVIGNSGGAPETVRPGETGFAVDPEDPAGLAERLLELLLDRARAAAMGAAGRTFVTEHYGADRARRVIRTLLAVP